MSGNLLDLPNDDELAIELEPDEVSLEIEPDAPRVDAALVETLVADIDAAKILSDVVRPGLVEILPADYPLPLLTKFIPNPALRKAADDAAAYALTLTVEGAAGIQSADLALTALRATLTAITTHFEEPTRIANDLHKRLTGIRGDWQMTGADAVRVVGQRIFTEQRRLQALADEQRRKDQAEADQRAREDSRRAADEAARNRAPAAVVEEMKRQAEVVTAPPVAASTPAPVMRGSTTVTTWKARIAGTPASDEPNPTIDGMTPAQRSKVLELLKAIVDGKAPLAAIEISWSYLNKRSKADKSALAIAGIEPYEEGGVRAKGSRSR